MLTMDIPQKTFILALCAVLGGCSLAGSEGSDVPRESESFHSDDNLACIRDLHVTTDTTSVIGSWRLVEMNTNVWIEGCMREAGPDLADESHDGLEFGTDGTVTYTGAEDATAQAYSFEVSADTDWIGLRTLRGLTPLSVHADTLVMDYRAVDGAQWVYVRQ